MKDSNLSVFIKKALIDKNETVKWLAKELGITTSAYYARLENMSYNLTFIIKLAEILNVETTSVMDAAIKDLNQGG